MEHLISPISDESTCGEYLKDNRTVYRGLRNHFNMAQSSFRQLLETPDATADEELLTQNSDNWRELASQCDQILSATSKDVEVFCWFITAQMFTNVPMVNTAKALDVFAQVVQSYWSDLQPILPEKKLKSEDEAGRAKEIAEFRIKPLLQLVGETENSGLLYMPLQLQSLIGDIDFARYAHAERSGQLAELKVEAAKALASDRQTVTETVVALGDILQHLESIERFIAEECQKIGSQGLSFRFAKKNVESLINAIKYLVGDQLNPWPLDKAQPASEEPQHDEIPSGDVVTQDSAQPASSNKVVSVVTNGEIISRDHAFNELRKVADYFLKTEPHSPVYMLIERAIRWGYMPLPALLQELVGDNDAVMGRITNLAGLESTDKTDIPKVMVSAQTADYSAPNATPVASAEPQNTASEANTATNITTNTTTNDSSSSSESEGNISNFEW
ncbi:ImpA family type VI secretion system protein [Litoribrevibacter albus]|uniref:Type VI secretion protein n=1 Tax=Litoribrevibacter albus TaxID=1473156 RepID=A0AA37SCM3_9GAMM|nr:type VI secretion system ImpA family N-terminal domain-containing protein [Litoribrevibacter albus]GLQ32889.1 type VI secretion protein [Litoribrevibacter albus]